MKLISHRGNVDGRNEPSENNPKYIDNAISLGFDVEIDLWFVDNSNYLGHDKPEFIIDLNWLYERKDKLWVHCKNISALNYLKNTDINFNYFFHQNDDVTITSMGYFWTYPGKELTKNSIACLPEISDFNNLESCMGICSDFISNFVDFKIK